MPPQIRIEMFGGLRLVFGEQVTSHFRTRKTASVLAYLAYFRRTTHPREVLIDVFWPEDDPAAARHSLSMALSSLRALLEPIGEVPDGSVLKADRFAVSLDFEAVATDVAEFEQAITRASRAADDSSKEKLLAAAIELHKGELLPGFYTDWILGEEQRLEELYFQASNKLVSLLELGGRPDEARQLGLRTTGAGNLKEVSEEAVDRLHESAGRRSSIIPPPKRRISVAVSKAVPDSDQSLDQGGSPQTEHPGGAVPLKSPYYVERPADEEFYQAIAERVSIVLVKGARQVGKSSLLARGLQRARTLEARVVFTNLQGFFAQDLESPDRFLLTLAENIADQVDIAVAPSDVWDERRAATSNFRRFISREVLGAGQPLVWGLDEVDRLLGSSFSSDVFGMFRSWHDARALDPNAPWGRLTVAMAYSTEAHLLISDVNQSPFNVGTRLWLNDFTMGQVEELNRRHGSPLRSRDEVQRFMATVGGQPYLVRRGLHELSHGTSLTELESGAKSDDWVFGEHLRRIAVLLSRDVTLSEAATAILRGEGCRVQSAFERLRSAGVLSGETCDDAAFRCPLYESYLRSKVL